MKLRYKFTLFGALLPLSLFAVGTPFQALTWAYILLNPIVAVANLIYDDSCTGTDICTFLLVWNIAFSALIYLLLGILVERYWKRRMVEDSLPKGQIKVKKHFPYALLLVLLCFVFALYFLWQIAAGLSI